ncbi:Low temperature viability protein [Nemania sp. NC0429]|nr:Low temperature viability protein [Nemania sp. NC0429]
MPKGKWINKKTAQHFTLVHRPQNDPLIHDAEAPSMILNPTNNPNAAKGNKLSDLASVLSVDDVAGMRANEGEAANYGVYFDDTEYDYMQHLRDLGSSGAGDVVFVEAKTERNKGEGKGKHKQSLEDAIRQLDLEDEERKKRELFDDSFLPSKNLRHMTYQAQQDVPDAIAGFQPDMDPRLREVLEALEDEAYVDGDDDDELFQELAKDGRELDDVEFENEFEDYDDDDGGWETDDTAKPRREYKKTDGDEVPDLVPVDGKARPADQEDTLTGEEADVVENENWLEDFQRFKNNQKTGGRPAAAAAGRPAPSQSDAQSSIFTTTTNGGRRKKRKGAMTSRSGYSMTSSSLVRTEQLSLLDARFEVLEQTQYNPDLDWDGDGDDGDDDLKSTTMSMASTASSVTGPLRSDFDSILDDFLGDYSMHGKKTVKKGQWGNGVEQFDEFRRALGPARVPAKYGVRQRPAAATQAGGASTSSSR